MKIAIGSDHAGFEFKKRLIQELASRFKDVSFEDVGTHDASSVDYPDYADRVAQKIKSGTPYGILICGSGQGMCMRANRYLFVRAALVYSVEVAKLARQHNNANVICLGARLIDFDLALLSCAAFFSTDFEGGRHSLRVEKLKGEPK